MVDRFERFSAAITEINRYWHKIASDEMKRYGLKGPFALYLVALYRNPTGLTATQLCEACDRNKADVSRAVQTLEEKGLLCREKKNNNGYRAKILLTDEGKTAAAHVREAAETAVEIGGHGLSEEERATFYRALEVISGNLQGISKAGLPREERG